MEPAISYYFPLNPPYFLFMISLVAGLACGRAFEVTLRELVLAWSQNHSSRHLLNLKGMPVKLPYIGITICVGVFLSAGLEIFGFPPSFAYKFAVPITIGIAYLVWRQLGKLLVELERGGSAAMDLDIYEGIENYKKNKK